MENQGLGEVLLLDDSSGLAGMAVCHVRFGLARPGSGADVRLETLLDACESLAVDTGRSSVPGRRCPQLVIDNPLALGEAAPHG